MSGLASSRARSPRPVLRAQDVVVGNLYCRNELYRNLNGHGFELVSNSAIVTYSSSPRTHALAWADVDNDGLVDLAAGTDRRGTKLFRNTGSGTFAQVSLAVGTKAKHLCQW